MKPVPLLEKAYLNLSHRECSRAHRVVVTIASLNLIRITQVIRCDLYQ